MLSSCSADELDADRQIDRCPCPVSGEDLRWIASDGEREAASIREGEGSASVKRAHRAGQLGVLGEKGLDADTGAGQEGADACRVDLGVDELPDDLGKVDGGEYSSSKGLRDPVGTRFVVNER